MKIIHIFLIGLIIYILFNYKSEKEHYYNSYTPYKLNDINSKDNSYGYPFYYTPISNCNPSHKNCLNKSKMNEHFQQTAYKTCTPIATLTLYTSSNCGHCQNMKPEWNKFINHINSNCKYKHLLKIENKTDDELDDDIKYVPCIKLNIKEDKINKIPAKTIEFKDTINAGLLEKFVMDNIMNNCGNKEEDNYYVNCKKGKMYGKFYTLCDSEHKKWNTY